jgi:hypothetical protein
LDFGCPTLMEAEWRLATHSLGVVVLYMVEELHFRVFSPELKIKFHKGLPCLNRRPRRWVALPVCVPP